MAPTTSAPGRTRGQGQWKLGHREPLNPNERSKRDDNPLNVRSRIENIYAKRGFDSIDPADLRGRFRWMGLYTQRKPGIDGGRTAALEPEELDDEYFMMRVRLDGGSVSVAQLRALGEVSRDYGRDTADVTDRENIQYHWIRVEDVPAIWNTIEPLGMQTTEACGDCPRVVLGSPVAGVSADEVVDPTPAIDEIVERFIGDRELSNLPRKFKTAISWQQDVAHEVNDISFVGVEHPEHGPGFDLWVGGGLSTNPKIAQRLGVWVPLADVPDVWHGVVQVFRDYGYRRLRHRARIKFLIADWGPEKFRQVLEDEYLGKKLSDGPAPAIPERPIDHVGVYKQKDGRNYVGVAPPSGRVSGTTLVAVAEAAERAGSDRIRFTPYQKIVVLDVADDKLDGLIADLNHLGLPARPSTWRRATMACTGIEFCKLAIVETKERAIRLVEDLEKRLADVVPDVPISLHLNGCPNACARTQVADIGLKGQIVTDADGNQVEGFQVHLGGGLGLDAGFGRKLRGLKVTSAELGPYVERIVRNFAAQRDGDERFAQWVLRAEEADLK
ncbi:Ferredoxin--sulfite reductase, actinobacterial type [Pseudonocardia sp. Ae168_Ps1]|uniref:nitrite/sulfite reductase n=1 Tax=unclassified Pseudonocardia TaxID=2619320 RepID=UPI0006CB2E8D|nr:MULTISPECIES: nitrite/sulfite reductase [unclassified Pseudonocardia]ALE72784.1 sulfite reductase [Pseudonocardia sp. EC080625-04]ALL76104.1 sulfite reductase [Pseudonocardia sp. EC080610-09]OLL73160.1 Ferredoxin--sulfite reductase, actinobacterial type [Pseudonocardia sp. Ae150A_Ps1]OLL79137.1 Ferredoxin--sulfite reductase, actinobacterial type [Pseudonocardia sp. Ae168_Ps1]OLL86726.1 Ferredoxin--sulfite reductase, actinobacterial type [Pseudonocardia sp. Ae263_Ps1]